jgi:hypothetical protein
VVLVFLYWRIGPNWCELARIDEKFEGENLMSIYSVMFFVLQKREEGGF